MILLWRISCLGTVTVLALFFADAFASQQGFESEHLLAAADPPPATRQSDVEIDTLKLDRLSRQKTNAGKVDMFNAKSWYVPPPRPAPPPPPPPPPPPSAPPLPFTFLGKLESPDGNLTIYLAGRNKVYLVNMGEIIDGIYRVDGVELGNLALTYLPLQIKQHLNMGEIP